MIGIDIENLKWADITKNLHDKENESHLANPSFHTFMANISESRSLLNKRKLDKVRITAVKT